jgi:hypothetical protein
MEGQHPKRRPDWSEREEIQSRRPNRAKRGPVKRAIPKDSRTKFDKWLDDKALSQETVKLILKDEIVGVSIRKVVEVMIHTVDRYMIEVNPYGDDPNFTYERVWIAKDLIASAR